MSTIALPTRLLAANFARDRIALLSFWLLAALHVLCPRSAVAGAAEPLRPRATRHP